MPTVRCPPPVPPLAKFVGTQPLAILASVLRSLWVKAWRFGVDADGPPPRVSGLRGVWGEALHDLSRQHYSAVFGDDQRRRPLYVVRQAREGSDFEFLLFGEHDEDTEETVWRAWHRAGCLGFGRRRVPFFVDQVRSLAWDGTELWGGRRQPGFVLYPLPWPLDEHAPCRLVFRSPLRILYNDRLVVAPTLSQLAVAALRRVSLLVTEQLGKQLEASQDDWQRMADAVPSAAWTGRPSAVARHSGTQRREISLRGISGGLDLPAGPGALMPLLAAAEWLHLGKATIMGLGRLDVEPLEPLSSSQIRVSPR